MVIQTWPLADIFLKVNEVNLSIQGKLIDNMVGNEKFVLRAKNLYLKQKIEH